MTGAAPLAADGHEDLRAVAAVTMAGLDEEARAQVRGLVAAAASRGWTCAALSELLRQLS